MKNYLELLREILETGEERNGERTGVGTLSLFGKKLEFDLRDGFPLFTTKKVHWKSVVGELLWFLSGSTNNNDLVDKYGVTFWSPWSPPDGELGKIYSKQWNDFGGVNQIEELVNGIIHNPLGRRHLVSAWNPPELNQCVLPPCHYCFQCYVGNESYLDMMVQMRSADLPIGVPYNSGSYGLLLSIVAKRCGLKPRKLIINMGDTHIYKNTIEGCKLQLTREPYPLPTLRINDRLKGDYNIADHIPEDFELLDYKSHPSIKMEVAV